MDQSEVQSLVQSQSSLPNVEALSETSVSIEAEIPEVLYEGMKEFVNSHPSWDQYKFMSSALANFLFQNGCENRAVSERYLNDLFNLAES